MWKANMELIKLPAQALLLQVSTLVSILIPSRTARATHADSAFASRTPKECASCR